MHLKGKVALITGSDGGIGLAIAEALAAEGCSVVRNGPAECKETLGTYYVADVGRREAIERMLKDIGPIDILVNNAVVRHFHPIEEFPVEEWERALAVNVTAAFHAIRLALPGMRQRDWGRIINMASHYSNRGCERRVDYVVSKHAIAGLTRTVALEVARSGITCNAIQPGWVHTPHAERQIADDMQKSGRSRDEAMAALLKSRQPSRRLVPPDDIAAMAVFLCTQAAANVNGALLPVDGGWTVAP
jgi:3-hydroxybutyrate dehydrogenase